jgi:hypothetical protein
MSGRQKSPAWKRALADVADCRHGLINRNVDIAAACAVLLRATDRPKKIDPADAQDAANLREMIRIVHDMGKDLASSEDALNIIARRFEDDDDAERKAEALAAITEMIADLRKVQRESDEALIHLLDVTARPQQANRKRQN